MDLILTNHMLMARNVLAVILCLMIIAVALHLSDALVQRTLAATERN